MKVYTLQKSLQIICIPHILGHQRLQHFCIGKATGQKMKTGAASHGSHIDNAVFVLAVTGKSCKQMLDGMQHAGGQIRIIFRIVKETLIILNSHRKYVSAP